MRIYFALVAASVLLCACDDTRTFEKNYDFKDRFWIMTEKPVFEFEVLDTASQYNLLCNVRNSVSYPYSRIFIAATLTDSLGNDIKNELITKDLFERKTGEPTGSSALGDIYDHQISFIHDHKFSSPGKYQVRFEQFMRSDTLRGVLSLGLRVEKGGP
jgi:gliding motility-associated lipoprotein GldH